MTTTLTPQAIVDDLAAWRGPCEGANLPTHPTWDTKCPVVGCACKGTGTVLAFPWLWEKGCSLCRSGSEHVVCDGSGQRVRRVEEVHLEEVLEHIKAAGWCYTVRSFPQFSSVTSAPPEIDIYHVGAGSKDSHRVVSCESVTEAALRALHAAVMKEKP